MGSKFSNKKEGRLPAFVSRQMLGTWKKQKIALETDARVASWVTVFEWPDFFSPDFDQLDTATPREEERPIERDARNALRLDIPTLYVKREHLVDLMKLLKTAPEYNYNFLLHLSAVDFLNSPDPNDAVRNNGKRFQVLYMLRALHPDKPAFKGLTIRVLLPVNEDELIPSLTSLWVGANWPEREVFDMFGLKFEGHPDLRRIIMPENYRGFPLRKDFPVGGIGEDYLIEDLLTDRLLND